MRGQHTFLLKSALAFGVIVLGLRGEVLLGQSEQSATASSFVELVMFEQAACEWCEVWDEQVGIVYAKTTEGRRAPLRRLSIHDEMPADVKVDKPVVYTPTFVLVEKGIEVGRISGYPGEDFFWGMLEQLLKKLPNNDNSAS